MSDTSGISNAATKASQWCESLVQVGRSTTNNAGGMAQATGNQLTVNNQVASGTDTLSKVGAGIGIAYVAFKVSTEIYDRYIAKDDAPLIGKFTDIDCGGLSKMPSKIEGCYKKYLQGAIHRISQKAPWETTKGFYDRFHQCFG